MTDHSSTPARRPWPAISRRAALRTAGVAAGAGAVAALMPGVASATTSKPMAAPVRAAADPVIPAPVSVPLQLVPSDAGFNYSALTALGMAGYGLTEVGEVLTTIASVNWCEMPATVCHCSGCCRRGETTCPTSGWPGLVISFVRFVSGWPT